MKKIICLLLITLFLCSLAACSDNSGDSTSSSPASSSASSSVSSAEAIADSPQATEAKTKAKDALKNKDIDVDLTTMSSTMVYSEVQNMMQHPDEYLGKIVKMHGPFNVTEIDGNRYYACIIKDATACCSTGIEFVWSGNHSYPEDYPQKDQEITVTGTFNVYMEGKSKYLQLKDAHVVF